METSTETDLETSTDPGAVGGSDRDNKFECDPPEQLTLDNTSNQIQCPLYIYSQKFPMKKARHIARLQFVLALLIGGLQIATTSLKSDSEVMLGSQAVGTWSVLIAILGYLFISWSERMTYKRLLYIIVYEVMSTIAALVLVTMAWAVTIPKHVNVLSYIDHVNSTVGTKETTKIDPTILALIILTSMMALAGTCQFICSICMTFKAFIATMEGNEDDVIQG